MGSDRARFSFDPARYYRSVIAQQGRVTLEADINEAATIASEELRLETLDIVGPAGTPDDGYRVSVGFGGAASFDVSVGAGTMYVGGWRVVFLQPVDINSQSDWADRPSFPNPASYIDPTGNELIALLLTETAVSAVEDRALREVALGGPDTGARARLLQRILRLHMAGVTSCAQAAQDLPTLLAADGVALDPTLQLISSARLQAGFVAPTGPTDPCDPPAQGGFLGADNQLIRVSVISFDPVAKTGQLVWSYNNASFLYRATVAPDGVTIALGSTPVDAEHAPQQDQALEVLRTTAVLGNDDFVAATDGVVVASLEHGFSSDTGQIQLHLADKLPDSYINDTNPLFVRLWQAVQPFTSGQPVTLTSPLGSTGITVTITMTVLPSNLAARPFWHFAVRPNTPVDVYPARYADAGGQPPEGPRQWLCPLSVISWPDGSFLLLDDCRVPFKPLTEIQPIESCELVLGPADVEAAHGLQAIVDALAGTTATLALKPGHYPLLLPLTISRANNGLTLKGCQSGVTLLAQAGQEAAFASGLIVVDQASDITLERLEFLLPVHTPASPPSPPSPPVPASPPGAAPADNPAGNIAVVFNPKFAFPEDTTGALGVMVVGSQRVTIARCSFSIPTLPDFESIVAIGIFARGDCTGLKLRANDFSLGASALPNSVMIGFAQAISVGEVGAVLDDAEISGNRFTDLTLGVLVFAQLGAVRCFDNRVRQSGGGFLFADANVGTTIALTQQALQASLAQAANSAAAGVVIDGAAPATLNAATMLGTAFPAPGVPTPQVTPSPVASDLLTEAFVGHANTLFQALPTAKGPATQVPVTAAVALPSATADRLRNLQIAIDALRPILIQTGLVARSTGPVLQIHDNDLETLGTVSNANDTTSSLSAIRIVMPTQTVTNPTGAASPRAVRGATGAVMVQDNRIQVASSVPALTILYPQQAVVTGNLLVHVPNEATFVLVLLADPTSNPLLTVMSNALADSIMVVPDNPPLKVLLPNAGWEQLNGS